MEEKTYTEILKDWGLKGLKWAGVFVVLLILADIWGDNFTLVWQTPVRVERREIISPIIEDSEEDTEDVVEEDIEIEETEEVTQNPAPKIWAGEATWYGARPEWCVGCNPNFIMANGERLDDTQKTLAFNHLPLGTWVKITNVDNGLNEHARITDTGGFDSLGRIADLSIALRDSLGCGDLCNVTIQRANY